LQAGFKLQPARRASLLADLLAQQILRQIGQRRPRMRSLRLRIVEHGILAVDFLPVSKSLASKAGQWRSSAARTIRSSIAISYVSPKRNEVAHPELV
jgi:hypothetical protein